MELTFYWGRQETSIPKVSKMIINMCKNYEGKKSDSNVGSNVENDTLQKVVRESL